LRLVRAAWGVTMAWAREARLRIMTRTMPIAAQFQRLACLGLALAVVTAKADPWVHLHTLGDPPRTMKREADAGSLVRRGPWALFRERMVIVQGNTVRPYGGDDDFAINCLTGARGTVRYNREAPEPGEARSVVSTIEEVERHQYPSTRLSLLHPNPDLDAAQVKFACACPAARKAPPPSEALVRLAYESLFEPARRTTEYRLRYLRAESYAAAQQLVQRLKKGERFDRLAEAESIDRQFPGGDMGFHAEHAWPLADGRVFRSLKPGQYTEVPSRDGALYLLEQVRVQPAPPLAEVRDQVTEFVKRANACGWPWRG
jgi:hypothetical protein